MGNFLLYFFFKKTEMKSKWSFPPGGCPCDQVTNLKHGSPTADAHRGILAFRFPREMATHRPLSVSALTPPPPTSEASFLLHPGSVALTASVLPSCQPPLQQLGPLDSVVNHLQFANYQSPFISFIQPAVRPGMRHSTERNG